MPYADPDREAEYQAQWRVRNPLYHRQYNKLHPRVRYNETIGRTKILRDEDLKQQEVLAFLSRRKDDDLEAYRKREMQWIAVTGSLAESFEDGRYRYGGHAKVDSGG